MRIKPIKTYSPLSSKETTENPNSTKMPTKSRPKQAHKQREEEELIKGIANSLGQNASNKAKSGQDGQCETFGSYVCGTLHNIASTTFFFRHKREH